MPIQDWQRRFYAAVRKSKKSGFETVDLETIAASPGIVLEKALKDDALLPTYAEEHKFIAIVEFNAVAQKEIPLAEAKKDLDELNEYIKKHKEEEAQKEAEIAAQVR